MSALPIEASAVVKRFAGRTILSNVDLTVASGQLVALVGPDGAGKSTLIRMIAGLVAVDGGRLAVFGDTPQAADRSRIGYMPQTFGLYGSLTVDENIRLYAELRALDRYRIGRIEELLRITDLVGARHRRADALSGGMRQKLSLICTIMHDPDLLLLDEPAVGLDPIARAEILALLEAQREHGMGILWSTAYLDEAERCDAVCLLHAGEVAYAGPPARLSEPMRGRIFYLPLPDGALRQGLRRAAAHAAVMDSMPHGAMARLAFKPDTPRSTVDRLAAELGTTAREAEPRLEDGFIDLTGKTASLERTFVESYRDVPRHGDRPAIEAQGLTKRYGDFTAANDITFQVQPGEVFGLLGPNGAGKSTVFRMLCGLLAPTSGRGLIDGHDLRRSGHQARQALGYMAQRFSLYADLSVRQNLEYFAGCYGLATAEAKRAIALVVESYELQPFVRQNAGKLPLGFKQRLALAAAVMHQPSVLFLDEPTSGVDPALRRDFWAQIDSLVRKGVAVLVSTHFMDEAERCDRIAIIHRSRQISIGSPGELKRQAGHAEGSMEEAFVALMRAADADRRVAA